ncbi:MAG: hypothetical protein L6301_02515 [Desulfobacteraceae bacterium]|nr:hypothetical protein [Pseudomonadota bacterium]MCG2750701.1 hypothetical protein [Desulfobacteraceae bacterium]
MRYILLVIAFLLSGCASTEHKYLSEVDQIRSANVDSLNNLILEYKSKSGQFPLQSEIKDRNIQVFISNGTIPQWLTGLTTQSPIATYSRAQLEQDIEKVLGNSIEILSEPHTGKTYAPDFYVYYVKKDRACVAGYLHYRASKTKNIQNNYYKYELCNE